MSHHRAEIRADAGRPPLPMVYPRFHYRAPGSNVTAWARLRGRVSPESVRRALMTVRARHPLLDASIALHEDGSAAFQFGGTPTIDVQEVEFQAGRSPSDHALTAQHVPFNLENGPLARVVLVQDAGHTEIVVVCHHTICDGRSLVWLLRELVERMAAPDRPVDPVLAPPSVTADRFPSSPRKLESAIIGSVNRRWHRREIQYTPDDYLALHRAYWAESPQVHTSGLSREATRRLVERCRCERVTVHTALSAAFLRASEEIMGDLDADHRRISMAADLRPFMLEHPGHGLGLCASGISVDTRVRGARPFWGEARKLHQRIQRALTSDRSLYGTLALNRLDPRLVDALQFGMHGVVGNRFVERLLRTMKFDKVRFGLAVTNLGRMPFPARAGSHEVEHVVFQPPHFPNLEKVLGVLTTDGRMRLALVSHPRTLTAARASEILTCATDRIRTLSRP